VSIYLGSAQPTTYKLGSTAVSKVYLGATQVWPAVNVATDPYWDYVTLLMLADGSGGTFVDSSPYARTLTATGATQSTTNGRASWGGSSAYFTGTSSRIELPNNIYTSLSFPENYSTAIVDYAVEAWLYIPTLSTSSGGGTFFSKAPSTLNAYRSFAFSANSAGLQLSRFGVSNASWQTLTFSAALPTNTWFHAAFARTSGSLRAYVNGSQVGSTTSDSFNYNWLYNYVGGNNTYIGSYGSANSGLDFAGYIDDLRVTRGSSRGYTSSTIPVPTAALPTAGTITAAKLNVTVPGAHQFVGRGTTAAPYYSPGAGFDATLKFTATAACTVSFSGDFYDDSGDVGTYPQTVYIKKRTFATSTDSTVYSVVGGGVLNNLSISMAAGDYIWFAGTSDVDYCGTSWMIISAA